MADANEDPAANNAAGAGTGDDDSNDTKKKKEKKNHNKYRRDKPWDNETIDHWKVEPWKADDSNNDNNDNNNVDKLVGGHLLEESSFATLFPKYREHYLRTVWPVVTRTLDGVGCACELNLVEVSEREKKYYDWVVTK